MSEPNEPNVYGHCEQCGAKVHGDFIVTESESSDGSFRISIDGTPDRDFIVCDGCNALLCRNCAHYWQTGYCDNCLAAADDENAELYYGGDA